MASYTMDFEKPLIELEKKLRELKGLHGAKQADVVAEINYLEKQLYKLRKLVYTDLTPWQKVQMARHPLRPRTYDYVNNMFNDFTELHGDRVFKDDPAVVGGLAHLDKHRVIVVGHQKGKNAKTNVHRNFGMPHPEGYRKALRFFRMAEKFKLPVISFIDTPGAYPGVGAEERGQAQAIADNIMALSQLETPVIAVNIGEGGSGGALALSTGDMLIMLENSYYSVATPEACASILWHDETKAVQAAEALKLTAEDLKGFGIADEIISEPLGGAHQDPDALYFRLRRSLKKHLDSMTKQDPKRLTQKRSKRLRNIGQFNDKQPVKK
ncbi:MAG TPA: acetyl-CoA carboxylase carboxyltransferase subunit alpha [Actinobacteria bacterium]|nr:acetyl-CoA carboxylase carboxyltransferase subunit alpha [Actinomycetota bacterium]